MNQWQALCIWINGKHYSRIFLFSKQSREIFLTKTTIIYSPSIYEYIIHKTFQLRHQLKEYEYCFIHDNGPLITVTISIWVEASAQRHTREPLWLYTRVPRERSIFNRIIVILKIDADRAHYVNLLSITVGHYGCWTNVFFAFVSINQFVSGILATLTVFRL
jgi:hypothetical protein